LSAAAAAAAASQSRDDATVQDTDNDASVSRMSAVELGYLDDPFARSFVRNPSLTSRRLPIINRGTLSLRPIRVLREACLGRGEC
jgi:hypothetical protein